MHPNSFFVCQIGARRHYAVPRGLAAVNRLAGLHTDACTSLFPWSWLLRVPGVQEAPLVNRIADRKTDGVPISRLSGDPGFTVRTRLGGARQRPGESNWVYWARQNRLFCERAAKRIPAGADAAYVFNGAGLEILSEAKKRGLYCVVDQTSASLRFDAELLTAEMQRWPQWCDGPDQLDGWEAMALREEAEWRLADRIICGSAYVRDTLVAVRVPTDVCRVVPYGFPAVADSGGDREPGQPLRVLYAGTMSLRKGVPYLAEAMERLRGEPIQFRIVGPSEISGYGLSRLRGNAEVCGPVPRGAMAENYRWADVLVLPTVSEGSANVCYEALSFGVPVVTTPNAGSVVESGADGILVPIRDAAALAEALRLLLSDRELLRRLSQRARQRSAAAVKDDYAQRLVAALR